MIDLASRDALDAAEARSRFSRIELLGRESLDGMRTLLGLLRSTDRGAREPRPTLEQLDALLAAARDGGRAVDLEFEGERRPLGAGVELAAYRTLQHALAVLSGAADSPHAHTRPVSLRSARTRGPWIAHDRRRGERRADGRT